MKDVIQKLQSLITYHAYKVLDIENPNATDGLIDFRQYQHDVDFYFKEGIRIGLALGIELAE